MADIILVGYREFGKMLSNIVISVSSGCLIISRVWECEIELDIITIVE